MLGIPREYLNVRRPGSIIHWYRSLYVTKRKTQPEVAHVLPVTAQIEPTVSCDLNCTFCHSKDLRRSRSKQHMSYEEFRHILDQVNFLVVLGIVGMGEPTRNPDFFEMVRLTVQKGIATHTVTNCNLHTQEIAEQLICSGLKRIAVSIDGATSESYEKARRGARFERTLENLSRLVKYRGNRRYPRINVQMLPFDYNYREMPDLVRLCARIGVDSVSIQARLTDWGKDRYVQNTLQKGGGSIGEDFERHLAVTKQIAFEEGISFDVIRGRYDNKNKCPKPWREVYVSTTGDIVPCCAIADPRVKSMGNLFNEPFVSIWNNREYMTFRKAISSGKIPRCCFQCYAPDVLIERSRSQKGQEIS